MRTTLLLLAALAACMGSIEASHSPASERPWINARSTFFGRDQWSLHTGSCGYGAHCTHPQMATRLDPAAVLSFREARCSLYT